MKVFGVCFLCGVSTLLSAFSFLFLLAGAALAAWLISASKRPALTAAVPLLCTALLWVFSKDMLSSLITGLSVYLLGALAALGIKLKASFWKGSVFCSVGFAAYFGASFFYMLDRWSVEKGADGSIFDAAVLWWNEVTASAAEAFTQTIEAAELGFDVTKDMMDSVISSTTVLLPGTFAAVFITLGALLYLLGAVMHRAFATEELHYNERFNPVVGLHGAVFFIATVLLAAIVSAFKGTEVVQFAFVNIAIAMFIPLFITGVSILIMKIKAPRQVIVTPDGRAVRAPRRTFILWLIIPVFIMSPLMGMLFVAFYGASERINAEIFKLMKNKMDEKNKGNM